FVLFSSLICRYTLKSTIFPYTTLFRSGMNFYEKALDVVKTFYSFEKHFSQSEDSPEFSIASQHYDFLPPLITTFSKLHPEHRHLDRKSTRLNSSHVSISYAVFCLKKKT